MLQTWLRRHFAYRPLPDTEFLRGAIDEIGLRETWPICPAYQGDLLFRLARTGSVQSALEVGFATGSTAVYLLAGLEPSGGHLVSIDYAQRDFDYKGVALVRRLGFEARHELREGNSSLVLPDLAASGRRFQLAFLDGWKTFDHLMIDLFYCDEMLEVEGFLIFDDLHMPSVRKVVRFLLGHYGYRPLDYASFGEDLRLRVWYFLSQGLRRVHRPFAVFVKQTNTRELPVRRDWNHFRPF